MGKRLISVLAVAALASAAAVLSHTASADVFPPSLQGESFFSTSYDYDQTHYTCDPNGNSTIHYVVSGFAGGPYPGTFTETATVVIGPQTTPGTQFPTGTIQSAHISFTINSSVGTVTGTKDLAQSQLGVCAHFALFPPFDITCQTFMPGSNGVATDVDIHRTQGLANYSARITTSAGSFSDSGSASFYSQDDGGSCPPLYGGFGTVLVSENFALSNGVTPLGPAAVTLNPPDAVNTVGTTHTVTASVVNVLGSPVAGSSVLFTVQGSVSTTGSCATDSSGQCSFTYTGPQLPGADLITGCADSNSNGVADPGEPCGTATKAWLLPSTTPGQVTGGGQIANAAGNDQIAFGFNAKSDKNGVKGECTVVDPSTNTKIKCIDATTMVENGTHATFFGNATVNGVATTYRIDVDDLAEPGKGRDTFTIQTASGYTAGGVITNGNIQVH